MRLAVTCPGLAAGVDGDTTIGLAGPDGDVDTIR